MSLIEGADVAGLLEALGRPAAAATVRWSEDEPPTAVEFEAQADELLSVQAQLAELESLLCKACAKKWGR